MSDFKIGHAQSYICNQHTGIPDTNPLPPTWPIQQMPILHKLEGMDKLLELLERLVVVAERMESKPPPPVYHTGPMMPPLTITGKPNLTLTGEPKKHFTDSGKD